MSARPILITAGGTGGHMFPANSLAEALIARGHRVALVTDARGGAFQNLAVETHRVRAGSLAGGIGRKLRGGGALALGTLQAARLVRRLAPVAAVGFGGYASVPAMLAAARARVPTLIHEQNGVMGRANRLLAPLVAAIAVSMPNTVGLRAADRVKARLTGNPVRAEVAALARAPYRPPGEAAPLALLVVGGSQGATVFSEVVPAAMALLPDTSRQRIEITQQCRYEDLERARAAFAACGLAPELAAFIADLPARLSAAHLVLCRAGASTVAELTAAGRPAVLVPYPHAADDHQAANARALADTGGAWLLPEDDFTPTALAARLEDALADPEGLAEAARRARAAGHPDAAERLANMVDELVGNNGGARRGRDERGPVYREAAE